MIKLNYKKIFLNIFLILITIFLFTQTTHADSGNLIPTINQVCKEPWKIILSFVDYVAVAFLIIISFVNILHLKIDVYAIRKALPMLILGIILANLSWFICMMFIDFAELISSWLTQISPGATNPFINVFSIVATDFVTAGSIAAIANFIIPSIITSAVLLPIVGISLLVIVILIVFFFAVWILFWVRGYVIILLVIISPLAFLAMALPMTQKLFQQWFSMFLKWVFLAPLLFVIFFITLEINQTFQGSVFYNNFLVKIFLVGVCMYAAIRVPFMLSGSVGGAIFNLGSTATKKLGAFASKSALGSADTAFKNRFDWSPMGALKGFQESLASEEKIRHVSGMPVGQVAQETMSGLRGVNIANVRGRLGPAMSVASDLGQRQQAAAINELRRQPILGDENYVGKATRDLNLNTGQLNSTGLNSLRKRMVQAADNGVLSDITGGDLNKLKQDYKKHDKNKNADIFIDQLEKINDSKKAQERGWLTGAMPNTFLKPDQINDPQKDRIMHDQYENNISNHYAGQRADKVIADLDSKIKSWQPATNNRPENGFYTNPDTGEKIHYTKIAAIADYLERRRRSRHQGFDSMAARNLEASIRGINGMHFPTTAVPLNRFDFNLDSINGNLGTSSSNLVRDIKNNNNFKDYLDNIVQNSLSHPNTSGYSAEITKHAGNIPQYRAAEKEIFKTIIQNDQKLKDELQNLSGKAALTLNATGGVADIDVNVVKNTLNKINASSLKNLPEETQRHYQLAQNFVEYGSKKIDEIQNEFQNNVAPTQSQVNNIATKSTGNKKKKGTRRKV